MRRRWAAIAVAGTAALVVLAAPATAARRVTVSTNLELVGKLTIAWQGDQARGCAAAGLCGVRGSIQMLASGGNPSGPGLPSIELLDPSSAARVIELSTTGATEQACADLVPVDIYLAVTRSSAGQLRALLDRRFSGQLPSAGRCAGPTDQDLSGLALPARKDGRHGYDLSGRVTFGAGPFTVTAISTLRAVARGIGVSISSMGSFPSAPGTVPSGRNLLQEHAEAIYRIAGFTGALTTAFSGLAAPLCDPLGACGSTGGLSEAYNATGTVGFAGSRFVKRRMGARTALADFRAGRLGFAFNGPRPTVTATLSEVLTWPDGTTCTDRSAQTTSLLETFGSGATLALEPAPTAEGAGNGEPLRTRCPGPSATDILSGTDAPGTSRLATATVPVSALGDPRLTVTFRGDGSFTASDYAGERGGSVVLSLVLVHASGGTSGVRAFAPIRTGR